MLLSSSSFDDAGSFVLAGSLAFPRSAWASVYTPFQTVFDGCENAFFRVSRSTSERVRCTRNVLAIFEDVFYSIRKEPQRHKAQSLCVFVSLWLLIVDWRSV